MTTDATIAKSVCTNNELDVLHTHAAGFGRRSGSRLLNISEDAWRWRLNSAFRKIQAEKETKPT